jgi:hypothetical protein
MGNVKKGYWKEVVQRAGCNGDGDCVLPCKHKDLSINDSSGFCQFSGKQWFDLEGNCSVPIELR